MDHLAQRSSVQDLVAPSGMVEELQHMQIIKLIDFKVTMTQ